MPAHTIRLSLTKRADKIACSYMVDHPCASDHVLIEIIPKRSWLARLFLGSPYASLHCA